MGVFRSYIFIHDSDSAEVLFRLCYREIKIRFVIRDPAKIEIQIRFEIPDSIRFKMILIHDWGFSLSELGLYQ